jgi:hypothetical protein
MAAVGKNKGENGGNDNRPTAPAVAGRAADGKLRAS